MTFIPFPLKKHCIKTSGKRPFSSHSKKFRAFGAKIEKQLQVTKIQTNSQIFTKSQTTISQYDLCQILRDDFDERLNKFVRPISPFLFHDFFRIFLTLKFSYFLVILRLRSFLVLRFFKIWPFTQRSLQKNRYYKP